MHDQYKLVLKEIESVLEKSDFTQIDSFASTIINSKKIVVFGAGRVGLVMKSFGMRLNHLDIDSYFLGDANVPKLGPDDLLLIGSGSGNTSSVANIVEIATKNKIKVMCITANRESRILKHSCNYILLNCQTKESLGEQRFSKQPMTTLFEQSLSIFLDSLVLILMALKKETNESMLERHNILE